MSMFPIRLDGVRYEPAGRTVLAGVDLALSGEGITVLLGPNGSGKTVLMRLVAGLQPPDAGRIDWGGAAAPTASVAMVFQAPMVIRASVAVNVELGLRSLRLAPAERAKRVAAVLERVGLAHRRDDPARLLSGGETQRLALARAWAIRPRLLLLDEPTASLDPTATEQVERIVREIRTEGAKVLLSTHNLAQATRIADDIVFISAGKIGEHVPAARFFARPQSDEARLFIQAELPWRIAFPD